MEPFGRPLASDESRVLDRALATLQVICGALAGSSAMLGLVGWLVVGPLEVRTPVAPPPDLPGLPLFLTALAAILLLTASRLRASLLRRVPPRLPGVGDDPAPVLAAYQRASIVCWALFEGIAVVGLVLSLLTGEVRYAAIFSIAAVLSILVRWPRRSEVERLLRRRD